MITLNTLKNTVKRKTRKRVGRGIGSGLGKTCGRGEKGAGSRSGWKRRDTYEGGQMRLFQKLPFRGFSNERFRRPLEVVNLSEIQNAYEDGETVNILTLAEKGLISGSIYGVKLLAKGDLTKKVTIELDAASNAAIEKLRHAKIKYSIPGIDEKE